MKNISAHLQVIREATVFARYKCINNDNLQMIHDLMDAIHNTTEHIEKDYWKDEDYISMYYLPYDKQWGSKGLVLIDVYKKACNPQ